MIFLFTDRLNWWTSCVKSFFSVMTNKTIEKINTSICITFVRGSPNYASWKLRQRRRQWSRMKSHGSFDCNNLYPSNNESCCHQHRFPMCSCDHPPCVRHSLDKPLSSRSIRKKQVCRWNTSSRTYRAVGIVWNRNISWGDCIVGIVATCICWADTRDAVESVGEGGAD